MPPVLLLRGTQTCSFAGVMLLFLVLLLLLVVVVVVLLLLLLIKRLILTCLSVQLFSNRGGCAGVAGTGLH
jgi:hypothetical protein